MAPGLGLGLGYAAGCGRGALTGLGGCLAVVLGSEPLMRYAPTVCHNLGANVTKLFVLRLVPAQLCVSRVDTKGMPKPKILESS